MMEGCFSAFPKIARLNRDMIVTEKIDGTNASVELIHKCEPAWAARVGLPFVAENDEWWLMAGSRTRYITVKDDNYGFAKWTATHADELFTLGMGVHYGEWWGQGVQRGYGLKEKRFSLFNVSKWADDAVRPVCCHVVPVLARWTFDTTIIDETIAALAVNGSSAAPGFMKPEGVVVYHTAANQLFKVTLEKDAQPKGQLERA